MKINHIDCTLRDGGYYNNWDFPIELINEYLSAMAAISVDYVELGLRSFDNAGGFKGACAYTTDRFVRELDVPAGLKVGVMANAAELLRHPQGPIEASRIMFAPAAESPVSLIRLACHVHEFVQTLPVVTVLKDLGYVVGINLMQVADRSDAEIEEIARKASAYPIDALYFADSLGSMDSTQTSHIVGLLRRHWTGEIGIHTHDNMGRAVSNSEQAVADGVTWIDSTVTGMGRGPGNAQTEYVTLALERHRKKNPNLIPLLVLIRERFQPMKDHYGWGSNPYYYLAGKYGIHPSYIQEMLADQRYSEEDILAVIEHLKEIGGKRFNMSELETARQFYTDEPRGAWAPSQSLEGRTVLVLGSGPGVHAHRTAIESYIYANKPFVIALNTQQSVDEKLIDARAACHPVRLLADGSKHSALSQPLIAPGSSLPEHVLASLGSKPLLDFGIRVKSGEFVFGESYATIPTALVIAYVLAIATSGRAKNILLAGFDGYGADDPRSVEMEKLLHLYQANPQARQIAAITPTKYSIESLSVYAL